MRFHALAADYDGTLAHHGQVDDATLAALERLRASGRKLIMVTGRELDDLARVFPAMHLFDRIVAENGALLYHPATREERPLGEAPPVAFVNALEQAGVRPLSVGRVIVATWEPNETVVLDVIRSLGLELHVIFNKGAVMILPAGITKATGLAAALAELKLSSHEVVGVGDAENDHAFLAACECSVAVANALGAIKERVDLITREERGAGVAELIDRLIADDLASEDRRLARYHLSLGTLADGASVDLPPYGPNVLIAGPSASGKSSAATVLLEGLMKQHYQFCILDPEGDHDGLDGAVTLGTATQGPVADEVLAVLAAPAQSVVVNLVGLPLAERPAFFQHLLPRIQELRARTGRPHWLFVDEAHHLLPATWQAAEPSFPGALDRTVFITVHPDQVARAVIATIGTVLIAGRGADDTLNRFTATLDEPRVALPGELGPREMFLWERHAERAPIRVLIAASTIERQRHTRKYAAGEIPLDRNFTFRGPEGKLALRAQNLLVFLQLADGIDDETWLYHLQERDYSRWFREGIRDELLARDADAIELDDTLDPRESRARMREAIERRYTLPTAVPPGAAP